MKSFKEYLTEGKKVYEFKIKIAGDCPKDSSKQIKAALSEFQVASCSAGKCTPIQESQADFPAHRNVSVTVFDVTVDYPATSLQIQNKIAEGLKLAASCVKARNLKEQDEVTINHEHDKKTGKAMLGTDYEACNHQESVGDRHVMDMLRELSKVKHQGTEYTGVNDELLADKLPVEKQAIVKAPKKDGTISPMGSKKSKVAQPLSGK